MTTTTATVGSERRNVWMAAGYAGLITALLAVVFSLLFQAEQLILYVIALLLIGAGPVLGYQLSRGKIFGDWVGKSLNGKGNTVFLGGLPGEGDGEHARGVLSLVHEPREAAAQDAGLSRSRAGDDHHGAALMRDGAALRQCQIVEHQRVDGSRQHGW